METMNRTSAKRPTVRLHQLTRLSLLIAVIIVQIQVPVPVSHDHEVVNSRVALIDHVERHHGDDGSDSGVHWHWVLPREAREGEAQDQSLPVPGHASGVVSVAPQSNSVFAAIDARSVPSSHSVSLESVIDSSQVRRSPSDNHFMTAAKHSCAVLCVIRC